MGAFLFPRVVGKTQIALSILEVNPESQKVKHNSLWNHREDTSSNPQAVVTHFFLGLVIQFTHFKTSKKNFVAHLVARFFVFLR